MNILFQEKLERRQLLALPPVNGARTISIAVHRNHSFELLASVLNAFLGISGIRAEFVYSDYDDSLSFSKTPDRADIHLLWVDASRYSVQDFRPWLMGRVAALTRRSEGTVLVAWCGEPHMPPFSLPDVLLYCCDDTLAALAVSGAAPFDPRLEAYTGTRLSNAACLALARELGLRYIPAVLFPPLKVLVLDLDNTLYQGVLGEDGPEGVAPYTELQNYLAGLARQGFMLALASKNDHDDVARLFALRRDFPLRWDDFSACRIDWEPKAENIERIAASLRVGLDSILFVDDNPGERLQVARTLPAVHILDAGGPEETLAALRYCPGLFKTGVFVEDHLRNADVKANARREQLQASLTPEDYQRELKITLTLDLNPARYCGRITELLHKTNQFILTGKRPSQRQVLEFLHASDYCIVTASMTDKLCDSGLIAVGLFSAAAGQLRLEELVISCRALGRGVEDAMIKSMLHLAAEALNTGPGCAVSYARCPRNTPARVWLQSLSSEPLAEAGVLVLPSLPPVVLPDVSVRVQKEEEHNE